MNINVVMEHPHLQIIFFSRHGSTKEREESKRQYDKSAHLVRRKLATHKRKIHLKNHFPRWTSYIKVRTPPSAPTTQTEITCSGTTATSIQSELVKYQIIESCSKRISNRFVLGSDEVTLHGVTPEGAWFSVAGEGEDVTDCLRHPFMFMSQYITSRQLVLMPMWAFHRLE